MTKFIKYILVLMGVSFFSCSSNKQETYYSYGTKEYHLKEVSLSLTTDEAALLFSNFYFNENPDKKNVEVHLNLIYDDFYIFSDRVILYNAKTGDYITEDTYWVNGRTKQIKKVDRKKLKIIVPIPMTVFSKEFTNKTKS